MSERKVIEAKDAVGSGLRVEFSEGGDRVAHSISVVTPAGVWPVLKSVEGSPRDDWPPSPPLQNVSLEMLTDGRQVVFLVGMAGGSHWSASVEALEGQAGLVFDIACRHRGAPGRLGSQYGPLSNRTDDVTINGAVSVVEQSGIVVIGPREPLTAAGTTRWRYVVALKRAE